MTNHRKEFLAFLAVGAVAAAVNWLSRILLSRWLHLEVAIVVAHLIGMVVAYFGARRFAFSGSGAMSLPQFGRFALVNAASLTQTWLITIALNHALKSAGMQTAMAEATAHAIGIGSTAITSYWMHKHFSFGGKRDAAQGASS